MPATTDATCDGIDDDCDGKVDEDYVRRCRANDVRHGTVCNGMTKCVNGAVQCVGTPIDQESCNCLDDDCDGKVDEGRVPGGSTCTNCQCAFPCARASSRARSARSALEQLLRRRPVLRRDVPDLPATADLQESRT